MIGLFLALLGALAALVLTTPGPIAVAPGQTDRNGPRSAESAHPKQLHSGALLFASAALGILTGSVVLALLLASLVLGWPIGKRVMASSQARRALVTAVPDTLELVGMALAAGMSIPAIVDFVVDCGPPVVHQPFSSVSAQLRAGQTRRIALRSLAAFGDGAFLPMVDVLLTGERDGAPVALMLDRLAREASQAHRHSYEERARRTPVLLLGPLMICSLPAVLIGAVAPFLILTLGQTPL